MWVEFPVRTFTSGAGTNFMMKTGMATKRQRAKMAPHLREREKKREGKEKGGKE